MNKRYRTPPDSTFRQKILGKNPQRSKNLIDLRNDPNEASMAEQRAEKDMRNAIRRQRFPRIDPKEQEHYDSVAFNRATTYRNARRRNDDLKKKKRGY